MPVAEIKIKYFEDFLDYSTHFLFSISCHHDFPVALKTILTPSAG